MIDHVGLLVSDYEISKRFYTTALTPLGYGVIMEVQVSVHGTLGRKGRIAGRRRANPINLLQFRPIRPNVPDLRNDGQRRSKGVPIRRAQPSTEQRAIQRNNTSPVVLGGAFSARRSVEDRPARAAGDPSGRGARRRQTRLGGRRLTEVAAGCRPEAA